MENFGANIRETRRQCGLKGYELAKIVGVNPVYITQIEKHGKLPSPAIMQRIADALQDETLFKTYLKIKYPTMYEKLEKDEAAREGLFLNSEFQQIKKEIEKIKKKELTPEELKKLGIRISVFGSKVGRSVASLQRLIGELEKIKKLHPNLRNTLEQKEKSKN